MIKIALTGGIACGKSTVAAILSETGVPVCDADDLAREVLTTGSPQLRQVVEALGDAVLLPDGSLDRVAVAERVFRDAGARCRLEAIVHPAARTRWEQWLQDCEAKGCRAAVVVIPLLFEGDFDKGWDATVCVSAQAAVQVARLAVRGYTETEAGLRIASQMPTLEKERRADFVIINNASKSVLRRQTETLLERIVEKKT